MTRVALDSNILVYAELEPETAKGRRAAEIIMRAAHDGVIPVQVLGEFLRVVQRRVPGAFAEAVRQAALYRGVFVTPATTERTLADAAELVLAHRLQLWDAIICSAAMQQNAAILVTEDLQDGGRIGHLQLLNPFSRASAKRVDAALQG